MPLPNVGDRAPALSLQDQDGRTVRLSDYAGKRVVLYFYPKDDTPGCTVEACNFRDEHSALQAEGAVVLGVSPDDVKRHGKFAQKYSLPFPLLADTEHAVADAYGAWGEKSLYGRKFMGIVRSTVLIGADGRVERVWPKVKVADHVAEVLAALRGADAAPAKRPAAAKKNTVRKAAPAKKKTAAAAKR
jgi:thioredoxin-dependent peroxiredoxin